MPFTGEDMDQELAIEVAMKNMIMMEMMMKMRMMAKTIMMMMIVRT